MRAKKRWVPEGKKGSSLTGGYIPRGGRTEGSYSGRTAHEGGGETDIFFMGGDNRGKKEGGNVLPLDLKKGKGDAGEGEVIVLGAREEGGGSENEERRKKS